MFHVARSCIFTFMKQKSEQTEEEQKAEMQKWMAENKQRFDSA